VTNSRSFPAALAAVAVAGFAAAAAPAPTPVPPSAADTGTYLGGPARTNHFPDARLPQRPVVLWTHPTGATPFDPVVAGGTVYFGDFRSNLHAVQADSGQEVWQLRDARRRCVGKAVQVAGGRLYLSSALGVEALDPAKGDAVWRHDLNAGSDSPLAFGGRVFGTVGPCDVRALDAATGEMVWRRSVLPVGPPQAQVPHTGTASTDGESLFVPFIPLVGQEGRVNALDLATGDSRWTFTVPGVVYGTPVVSGGRVLVTACEWARPRPPGGFRFDGGAIYALDRKTGKPVWEFRDKGFYCSGVAAGGGAAYAAETGGRVVKLDLASGRKLWEYETPPAPQDRGRFLSHVPLLTADAVAFSSREGVLYCLAADTGALRWRLELGEGIGGCGGPVTDGRRIFVTACSPGGQEGRVLAVGEAP
jgi:outer membrane protein assembly factor BamB